MYDKIFDAISRQKPEFDLAKMGLSCDACDMGPCFINPFGNPKITPCSITQEEMVLKNLAEKVVEGLGEYKQYAQHLTSAYKINSILKASSKCVESSIDYTNKIEAIFSRHRKPGKAAFGLGGLSKDRINICAIAPFKFILEIIKLSRSEEFREQALLAGAKSINVVSLGYAGAEMAYQMGIPCIGNYLILDDALKTNALDYIYQGGDPKKAIYEAIEAYKKRDNYTVKLPTRRIYPTGLHVNPEAVNNAYRKGWIRGAVVLFGAASPNCTWEMQKLVYSLTENDYFVFVNGAHMYESGKGNKIGRLKDEYKIPKVLHIGFCEIGKINNLALEFKPTILVPGWKNAKILTSCLALVYSKYRIVMGTDIPVDDKVKAKLSKKGLIVQKDWRDVPTIMG
ncbi:MAG: anaerobic carbon-monoxide dehydrogenase catalytic subunit [Candidatus Methanofastidiosia archaeon]